MGYFKTICKNTLFVENAYLPSYIPNNANTLITCIVHYFLNSILPFFVNIPRSAPMGGGLLPRIPIGLGLVLSYS